MKWFKVKLKSETLGSWLAESGKPHKWDSLAVFVASFIKLFCVISVRVASAEADMEVNPVFRTIVAIERCSSFSAYSSMFGDQEREGCFLVKLGVEPG